MKRVVRLLVASLPLLVVPVPGHFHGLPVMGHATYVPEIKANSTRLDSR
jgi:hypothetical protein